MTAALPGLEGPLTLSVKELGRFQLQLRCPRGQPGPPTLKPLRGTQMAQPGSDQISRTSPGWAWRQGQGRGRGVSCGDWPFSVDSVSQTSDLGCLLCALGCQPWLSPT